MAEKNHPAGGAAVSRLAGRSLRGNRTRNFFVITAIVLTTLLLTSVFTMAFNINRSMELTRMKTSGGDFHGSFKYLTPDEAERLARHPSIKEYAKAVLVGEAVNEAFRGTRIEVNAIDRQMADHSFIRFEDGGLPTGKDEIAMNTWALDLLGVPHRLGSEVELELEIDKKRVTRKFTLSGYYKADRYVAMSGLAFVSEAFVRDHLSGIDPEMTRRSGTYTNTTRLDVMFNNAFGIEGKIHKVLADMGIEADYGVNWAYTSVELLENPLDLLPYAALLLIIMLSGYLLIYNIFHISVVRDIKFYGLLKTIGTTPRQLRRIITIQANRLYLIALPVGLLLGYGVGCWITPMLTRFTGDELEMAYSASPVIFAGAALFSYLTVRIAASKPGRAASRIAPVEAVKFTGLGGQGRKKFKRSAGGAKLSRMALANLFRHKKKLWLMLASLSLSLILFGIVYTLISSLNVNKYLSSYIAGDFVVKELPDTSGAVSGTALTDELYRLLPGTEGITGVDRVYFSDEEMALTPGMKTMLAPLAEQESPEFPAYSNILERGRIGTQLYGVDPGWMDLIQKDDILEGSLDRDKFRTGKYVLISEAMLNVEGEYVTYYHPGDLIRLSGSEREYEVMALLNNDALYAAGTQVYPIGGFSWYLPADEFALSVKEPKLFSLTLHAEQAGLEQAGNAVRSLVDAHPELTMKSREDYIEEMQGFITVFKTVGYGLSFIIALIGVLNYINTVITGILSRRHEFAVLESVGMTRRQLKRTLLYEGTYGTLLVGAILGTAGLYLIHKIGKGISDNMAFTVFRMSVWPILSAIPVLLILSATVTLAAYRLLTKATVVERLREAE